MPMFAFSGSCRYSEQTLPTESIAVVSIPKT